MRGIWAIVVGIWRLVMVLVKCIAVNGCNGWIGGRSHPSRTPKSFCAAAP